MSLYERLGQDEGIGAAVDEFYRRVVSDSQLTPYFEGVDMRALRRHQTLLLVGVTGGPNRYDGRDLAVSHQPLGITDADFDRVVAHLAATLDHFGVAPDDISTVGAALSGHRDAIVSRQSSSL